MAEAALRPRRAMLSVPGSNPRALAKAGTLAADVVMLDLEDSVAPGRKADAREAVRAALAARAFGPRETVVRVNGADTPWWADDLAMAATSGGDAVLLPKVDGAATAAAAALALDAAGAPAALGLWCMMETPRAILAAAEIAANPRVGGLVVGTADLVKALHARHTPDRAPLATALSLVVLAARAFGRAAIDAPFFDFDDMDGFAAACRQGADFGFDGKMVLHPKQIPGANAAFGPSAAELDHARRVIAAYAEAQAAGQGVTLLDGTLVEALHVAEATRLLALGDAIQVIEGSAA